MQKSTASPMGEELFFQVEFFFFLPSKVLHQMTRRGLSIEQAARDTRDSERKGRGGKWTPLGREVRRHRKG